MSQTHEKHGTITLEPDRKVIDEIVENIYTSFRRKHVQLFEQQLAQLRAHFVGSHYDINTDQVTREPWDGWMDEKWNNRKI